VKVRLPLGFGVETVPLARRNVLVDKMRLLRSASGITFAIFLMIIQLGFQKSFIEGTLAVIRRFDADLVIVSSAKYQVSKKSPFSRRQLYAARAVPGVASAHPVYGEWTRSTWQNPADGRRYFIQVLAFDPDQPAFLIPEVNAKLDALRQPDTVIMDTRSRSNIGDARLGLTTELAQRRLEVVGLFSMGPDFFTDGTLIMSDRNFEKFFPEAASTDPERNGLSERPNVEFGLIKVLPQHDMAAVQRSLRAALPSEVLILTRQQLMDKEAAFQAIFNPVGPIFSLGVLVGFIVGMMISYQILFNDISDQLSQYATLKAMGYTNGYLVAVVLQQAVFYGIVGFVPALIYSAISLKVLAEIALLQSPLSPAVIAFSAALTVGMCVISGLIAVRRVIKTDPAEVF
jgi:putative ABC transport system permease protein